MGVYGVLGVNPGQPHVKQVFYTLHCLSGPHIGIYNIWILYGKMLKRLSQIGRIMCKIFLNSIYFPSFTQNKLKSLLWLGNNNLKVYVWVEGGRRAVTQW